jgi:predicted small integral membrane protein
MWQSDTWNGKDTAMGIVTLWAGFAVLLAMNEPREVTLREGEPLARENR